LDYSAKTEGGTYKTDCFGYEDIAEAMQQLWKGYVDTGREPAIGENMGAGLRSSLMSEKPRSSRRRTRFTDLGLGCVRLP